MIILEESAVARILAGFGILALLNDVNIGIKFKNSLIFIAELSVSVPTYYFHNALCD